MTTRLDDRQGALIKTNLAIDSTGEIVAVEIPGDQLVSINIEATADASYAVDVAAGTDGDVRTPDTWFQDEVTYDQADVDDPQDIRDAFILGDRHLRIRVTTAAGAGETASVTIQEA